jgi:PncC family amidohydrolase
VTQRELEQRAQNLARSLRERSLRIVFAESCTGGLVSAVLTTIAGISEHLCGSAVVYRVGTKAEWLGVSRQLLESAGPVSQPAAEAMAVGVLARTPEAHLAVSVTGHLGPNAPEGLDGVVFVSAAVRDAAGRPEPQLTREFQLGESAGRLRRSQRQVRQRQAAACALEVASAAVACPARSPTP